MQKETLDQNVVNLAKAIRQTESGGNYTVKGKSGEYGAYQFTKPTWNAQSKKFGINVELEKATRQQQNEVAYRQLKEWKDKGYNVGQVASMWNAGQGEPDAYLGTFKNGQTSQGKNKYGVYYDVPAYAKSVAEAYQKTKSGQEVGVDPQNPSSVGYQPQAEPEKKDGILKSVGNALIRSEKGFGESIAAGSTADGFAGGMLNMLTLGKGKKTGKAIDSMNQATMDLADSQFQLIKAMQKAKAEGKDTSKLQNIFESNQEFLKNAPGTADIIPSINKTYKQVLGEAAGVLADVAMFGSYSKAGLLGKAPKVVKAGSVASKIPLATHLTKTAPKVVQAGLKGAGKRILKTGATGALIGSAQSGAVAAQEGRDVTDAMKSGAKWGGVGGVAGGVAGEVLGVFGKKFPPVYRKLMTDPKGVDIKELAALGIGFSGGVSGMATAWIAEKALTRPQSIKFVSNLIAKFAGTPYITQQGMNQLIALLAKFQ